MKSSIFALLDFPTPRGLRMHLSSLSTPKFATAYTLGSLSAVDGSISYLYSTLPLSLARSKTIDLCTLRGTASSYLCPPPPPPKMPSSMAACSFPGAHSKHYTSGASAKHGGTILAMLQHDAGKWSSEYLYTTDVAFLGWWGLYNCWDSPSASPGSDKAVGRLSAGAELYYGVLNKSAGMSTGQRYTALMSHPGILLTMALTLNPLMGHLSATYAVKAGENSAFARYVFI